jgi:hypothetical protein
LLNLIVVPAGYAWFCRELPPEKSEEDFLTAESAEVVKS